MWAARRRDVGVPGCVGVPIWQDRHSRLNWPSDLAVWWQDSRSRLNWPSDLAVRRQDSRSRSNWPSDLAVRRQDSRSRLNWPSNRAATQPDPRRPTGPVLPTRPAQYAGGLAFTVQPVGLRLEANTAPNASRRHWQTPHASSTSPSALITKTLSAARRSGLPSPSPYCRTWRRDSITTTVAVSVADAAAGCT